jgi:menaquinone-dependent protoporphyrinogen IX oxidase
MERGAVGHETLTGQRGDEALDATRIGIYYSSRTGNSEFVLQLLRVELESRGCAVEMTPVNVELIRQAEARELDVSSFDLVGVAHSVHGWNLPRFVPESSRRLPQGAGK